MPTNPTPVVVRETLDAWLFMYRRDIFAAIRDGITEAMREAMPASHEITDAITAGVRAGVDDRLAT